MAALSYVVVFRGGMGGASYGLRYLILEVESADADDTVTVSEYTTVKDTVAIELDTGAEVSCSEATNVITIDPAGALSDKPVSILVSGY